MRFGVTKVTVARKCHDGKTEPVSPSQSWEQQAKIPSKVVPEKTSSKVLWLALVIVLFPAVAHSQEPPAGDVSFGYSYLRLGGSDGTNQNGGSASFAYNVNHWLGLAADVGGYHSNPFGVDLNTYSYMFGPRLSYRTASRVTPFTQALLGAAHTTGSAFGASASNNSFAFSAGGGVEIRLSHSIAFRPQADYILLRSNGANLNCARVSAAIVFQFGGRR
jgi:opacity protein-like surface antigen